MPVIAPIGLTPESDELININADAVAGAVAVAVEAAEIVFMTDVAGVQDADGTVIDVSRRRRSEHIARNGYAKRRHVAEGGGVPGSECGGGASADCGRSCGRCVTCGASRAGAER